MTEPAYNSPPAPPPAANQKAVRGQAVVVCLAHGPYPLCIGPEPITFVPGVPTVVPPGMVETLESIREPKTNRPLFQTISRPPADDKKGG